MFLTSDDLDVGPYEVKIGTPVIRTAWNVPTNFGFCHCFKSPYETNRHTDG